MKELKIHIPGSKYVANRVLVMAALVDGKSCIRNVPDNQDVTLLLDALGEIGVCIAEVSCAEGKDHNYEIVGINPSNTSFRKKSILNAGESGTLLRFAVGFACLLRGETHITAGIRNRERPIMPLINAMEELGAVIVKSPGKTIYPVVIRRGLTGGRTILPGNVSSQFISSLLIVAPYSENDVEIKVGKPIVSSRYIDLTIREMKNFGVGVIRIENADHDLFRIKAGQKYFARNVDIPKDWSSTNYLLAAAVLLNKKIRVNNIDRSSNAGESNFITILEQMGCKFVSDRDSVSLVSSEDMEGIEIDMKDSPDSVLTLIAVALFAWGSTTVKNIGHLIYKESDRIKQIENELRKIGADIQTTEDSITVVGQRQLYAATTESHEDHRLAMCLGLIKLRNCNMIIENKECVRKSFPEFWNCIRMIDKEGEVCLEIQ